MKASKVFIAGHKGMVGSAITRQLERRKDIELVTRTHQELDFLDSLEVDKFFLSEDIDQVYMAAARVGGIFANNTYPAEFIYENLAVQNNIIKAAHETDVNKVLFLGSSCIYPKLAQQPIKEEYLLQGSLESTNEPYAIAKIAGIKMCESYNRQFNRDFRSVMPTNLYGPNDNFHPQNSHVIPAMLRRFHQAKIESAESVVVWGTGAPLREFLHVDDMASACVHVMELERYKLDLEVQSMNSHINVGTGLDCTISDLASIMAKVVGYSGKILFDSSKPDGTPRKVLNVSRLDRLGWSSSITLEQGLSNTYNWYLANIQNIRT
jgi:GDP-L-fucose synthase